MDDDYEYRDPFGAPNRLPFLKMACILGGAYLECGVTGVRFGIAATKTVVRGNVRLIDALQSTGSEAIPEDGLRLAVDEARSCLRDLRDAASHEFRRLQSRLLPLQEAARDLVTKADSSEGTPRRRWKAKT